MSQRAMVLAAAALVFGMSGQASAQSRAATAGWWPWAGGQAETVRDGNSGRGKKADKAARAQRRNDDEDREDRDERDGRNANAQGQRQGNGPPFCRNGQGHPTKGREWCEQKGWTQASWPNVIFRSPLPSNRTIAQPTVRDILGSVILGRLTDYSSQLGVRGPIEGRTFTVGDASILQLRAGGIALAELTDRNHDGRVDLVLLAGR